MVWCSQEDVPQFAGKIFSESQRLIDLVGDIIKISQLDEDMLPYERQTVDLYQLCGEICERLQQRAQAKGVTPDPVRAVSSGEYGAPDCRRGDLQSV